MPFVYDDDHATSQLDVACVPQWPSNCTGCRMHTLMTKQLHWMSYAYLDDQATALDVVLLDDKQLHWMSFVCIP